MNTRTAFGLGRALAGTIAGAITMMFEFDWFAKDSNDAISLLKRDHDTVKELFDEFEKAQQRAAKKKIVAKALTELNQMTGKEDHFDAKFSVLAESVRHHIKEEESEMLPKAKHLPIDFDQLGETMMQRKTELLETGIPASAEERVADPKADSPARA